MHSSNEVKPNLAPNGKPLVYWKVKKGPNAENCFIAEREEIYRLIDSGTMRVIFLSEQPSSRRSDTTYYNPQIKEKLAADGCITYCIRTTAGGDDINYPGGVSARTVEMEVVKVLFHSAASNCAGGNMLTADIEDFYFGTDLERCTNTTAVRSKQCFREIQIAALHRQTFNLFIATLENHYQLKVDWQAVKRLGFTVEFDDAAQTVY